MKLRIAVTRREYISEIDGVTRFVFTLADGLSSLGHDVCVISYSYRDVSSYEASAYLKNFFDFQGKVYTLKQETETVNLPRIALGWYLTGSRLLNDLDLDAVIMNGIVPLRTKAVKMAVNHGIFTGEFARAGSSRRHMYLQIARNLYRRYTDVCVCVSGQLQSEFRRLMKMNSFVIPLPVKLNLFRSEPVTQRDSTILHVGTRLFKNVELSIKSVEILAQKKRVDVKLLVIGSKTSHIEKLMSKYGHLIPKYLDFVVGPEDKTRQGKGVDLKTLQNLLAHARALVLPSKYEVLPYSVLEAFASGLPVVVSNAVPSEMVQDGFNGFRVQGFDPNLYAKKLAGLLTNDSLWQNVSRNALSTSRNYSHIKIAKNYESLLSTRTKIVF